MRSISILRGKFFLMLRSSYYIGCRLLYHLLKACGEEPECRYGPWNHTLSVSLQPLPPPAPHSIRIVSLNLRMLLGSSAGLSGWRAGNPEQSRLGGGAALLYRHYRPSNAMTSSEERTSAEAESSNPPVSSSRFLAGGVS